MSRIVIKKRIYHKPQLNLVPVDYSISLQCQSGPPGDPPGMKGQPATKDKSTNSPFGGSKPNYK